MGDHLIYIASPYTHPDPHIRLTRFQGAVRFLRWMLKQQLWAYSPIVHCHDAALGGGMPMEWEHWKDFNDIMLRRCQSVHVLMLEGWRLSKGVEYEVCQARELNLPVSHWRVLSDGYGQVEV